MTKAPTSTEMSKGQSDNTNSATKKFEYTVVADRLRTVSWSNYRKPDVSEIKKVPWDVRSSKSRKVGEKELVSTS